MSIEKGTVSRRRRLVIANTLSGRGSKIQTETELSISEIANRLTWYRIDCTDKDRDTFIPDYLKNQGYALEKIKIIVNGAKDLGNFQTLSHVCKILNDGGILPEKTVIWIKESFDEILQNYSVPAEVEPTKNITSIQEKINETVSTIIGKLEGFLDDYILSKYSSHTSIPALLQENNLKMVHANRIIEWSKTRRKEFSDALTSKDEYVIESYSNFKKVHLKKLIAYWDSVISHCISIISQNEATRSPRQPRKRKQKTAEQIVNKLNFCQKDKVYSFESIDPKKIPGSSQLWIFNVKTRKLGVYNAQDSAGLSVKGSTITNFDENTSISKTIRKPAESIPELIKSGKAYLKSCLVKINSKESVLTGRINNDTILLRIT